MNLWIQIKQENMSTKFLNISDTILSTKPSRSWQNGMKFVEYSRITWKKVPINIFNIGLHSKADKRAF